MPLGVAHTFRVDSETARVLVLGTPAGLERLVREDPSRATAPTLPPAEARARRRSGSRRSSAPTARRTSGLR